MKKEMNFRKRLTAAALALMLLLSVSVFPAFAAPEASVPQAQLIPLRAAVEAAGGSVTWNGETRTMEIEHESLSATLRLGSPDAVVNGEETSLDLAPAANAAGRAMVDYSFLRPLFVSENDPYADIKDFAVPYIYGLMEQLQVAGVTLSVVDTDSGGIWTQGFGYGGDVAAESVVTEDMQFEIGSISKTFTAMGIMQLVEKGLVDLDKPIADYLPDLKLDPHPDYGGDYKDITLRMIGNHTSGIPGTYLPHFMDLSPKAYELFNTVVEDVSTLPLTSAPGDTSAYSNMAVALLGAVIPAVASPEAAYLDGYTDYMEKNIFTPLGMENTSVTTKEGMVRSQSFITAGEKTPDVYISAVPSGSILSTASDMASYLTAMLSEGGDVLKKESVNEMLTAKTIEAPRAFGSEWGFIWIPYEYAEGKYIWMHDGATQSFFSFAGIDLENGLGVFLSTNTASGSVLAQYAPNILLTAVNQKTGADVTAKTYPETKAKEADPEHLKSLEGVYASNVALKLTANGSTGLAYEVMGMESEFVAQDDGTFVDSLSGARYFFEEIDGNMVLGAYSGLSKVYGGERVTEFGLDYFDGFEGSWSYVNEDGDDLMAGMYGTITIAVQDGYPVLLLGGAPALLVFADEDTAYLPGFMRARGEVLKLAEDEDGSYIAFCGAKFAKAE